MLMGFLMVLYWGFSFRDLHVFWKSQAFLGVLVENVFSTVRAKIHISEKWLFIWIMPMNRTHRSLTSWTVNVSMFALIIYNWGNDRHWGTSFEKESISSCIWESFSKMRPNVYPAKKVRTKLRA